MIDFEDSPWWRSFRDDVRRNLIPKLEDSGAVVSLVPDGESDVKFAVELGLSIMMDKPIIAVVRPGTKLPNKLVLVADHIVEADLGTETGQQKLMVTINELMKGES